jgi:hypothetical protein
MVGGRTKTPHNDNDKANDNQAHHTNNNEKANTDNGRLIHHLRVPLFSGPAFVAPGSFDAVSLAGALTLSYLI